MKNILIGLTIISAVFAVGNAKAPLSIVEEAQLDNWLNSDRVNPLMEQSVIEVDDLGSIDSVYTNVGDNVISKYNDW
jgi:hypothetical protein